MSASPRTMHCFSCAAFLDGVGVHHFRGMMCREEQATSPHAGEAKEPAAPPAVKPGVLDATQVLSGSSAVDGDGDDDKDGGAEGGGTEDGAGRRKDDFVIEKPTLKNEPPVYSHAQRKQRERVHELYEQMQRINQAKREAAQRVHEQRQLQTEQRIKQQREQAMAVVRHQQDHIRQMMR
jgi:hypothetical protein